MSNELRTYKRVWIWRERHKPEVLETREHRKVFRVFAQYWKEGKCAHCGILLSEAPSHNCFETKLELEMIEEFVAKVFSTE